MRPFLAAFGVAVVIGTVVLAIATEPLSELRAAYTDSFSLPSVVLAEAGGALALLLARTGGPSEFGRRVLFAGVLGALLLGLVVACFPNLLSDPFHGDYLDWWVGEISEGMPLLAFLHEDWSNALTSLLPMFLAAASAAAGLASDNQRRRPGLAVATLFCFVPFALSFIMIRTLPFAIILSLPLVVSGIGRIWRRAARRRPSPMVSAMRAGSVCVPLVLPLTVATAAPSPSVTGQPPGCDLQPLARLLDGQAPRALTSLDLGAEYVFRTRGAAMAGPFHRDIGGLKVMRDFLTAADADAAKAVVDRAGIQLLVFCTRLPETRLPLLVSRQPWASRLFIDPPPPWLEPLPGLATGPLKAWRVR